MKDITRERIDEIRRHYSIGEPGTGTWLAGTPESDIEALLSALDRRDELIRHLYANMATSNRQAVEYAAKWKLNDMAPEILDIVQNCGSVFKRSNQ